MPFTRPTLQEIVDRIESDMESRLTGDVSLLRRAVLRVLARVFAGAIHILYGVLQTLSKDLFVDQAATDMLDRHAIMWGVPRKAAIFATGDVVFDGVDTTVIPEGTVAQNDDGIEYETIEEKTISFGIAIVPMQAREAGTASNIPVATILELVSPVEGITQLLVDIGGIAGGQDAESDDDLRQRILERIQEPPRGGTAADYIFWAKQVAGVAQAWSFPLHAGPGTVAVVVKAAGADPVPDAALLQSVTDYIETVKPVTADVSIDPINKQEITFDISITPRTSDFEDAITDSLQQMFDSVVEPQADILISQIRNAISTTGIDNFDITEIRVEGTPLSSVGDIPLSDIGTYGDFAYGTLGLITYAELI